jgi:hypothetical protein
MYPRDGYGQDRIKKTLGVWTYGANANAKNGSDFTNTNLNATDCGRVSVLGIRLQVLGAQGCEPRHRALSCTDLSGNVELAATNIDFYAAAPAAAAVLLTKYDLKLGFHRIKLLATNTKNAASSAKTVPLGHHRGDEVTRESKVRLLGGIRRAQRDLVRGAGPCRWTAQLARRKCAL